VAETFAPASNQHRDAVRRYYDVNTALFRLFGGDRGTQTVHRSVWAEGITSLDAALNYTNALVLDQVRCIDRASPALGDLGCGTGGTLMYLAPRLTSSYSAVGVTLSPVQAKQARRNLAATSGPILIGDYHHLPLCDASLDFAFAIESFIHSAHPERFLAEVNRVLRPGGRLFVCDDFLVEKRRLGAREAEVLAEYRDGWLASSLLPAGEMADLACRAGLRLIERRDLTPYLKLRTLPERLAHLLLNWRRKLGLQASIVTSSAGSLALQQCLATGAILYQTLLFEKSAGF
jgi:cyclopropane fatty-acyl-phospholipid synthase-like methyltransferase